MTNTENWTTTSSAPGFGLCYQERTDETGTVLARVTVQGHEAVTPSSDTEGVHRQYSARYIRACGELEMEQDALRYS